MEVIKKTKFAVVALPWVDSLTHIGDEIISSIYPALVLVPCSHMRRVYGKVIKDRVWVVARVGPTEDAGLWRFSEIEDKVVSRMCVACPQKVKIPVRWNNQS